MPGCDRMNVLIVDDQASQRAILRHLVQDIGEDIRVTDFADPVQALLWSQQEPPDMVILDYRMPKMDGLEFARRFRRPLSQRDVPIMLVTVVGDEPLRQAALDAGIIDFMVKPIRPRELRSRCKNLLDLRQRQQALKSRTQVLEHQLVSGTHEMEQRELDLLVRLAKLASKREGADLRIFERIAALSGLLARAMGWDEKAARELSHASQLHDIGTIHVPDAVLASRQRFGPAERAEIQRHPEHGHRILSDSRNPLIELGAVVALHHHERWDGSGYPRGLAGRDIPDAGRIVAVADVLDALTTDRPYRPAMPFAEAAELILDGAGRQFDPALTGVFASRSDEFAAVLEHMPPPAPGAAET